MEKIKHLEIRNTILSCQETCLQKNNYIAITIDQMQITHTMHLSNK